PHEVVNINVPTCETLEMPMPEIKVVEMNAAEVISHYDKRVSPYGQTYYWAAGDGMDFAHTAKGSDVEALRAGFATVTPLDYVLTRTSRMSTWSKRLS
ncbi:MAG: hypothetical protein QF444_05980, partial [Phycisphaerales bacterium]|nr:hypothetical protein [Phycisphaerales bacterium]